MSGASQALGGIVRLFGSEGLRVAGSFFNDAANTTGPTVPGCSVARVAAGVYVITLSRSYQSVIDADSTVGPASNIGNAALATVSPVLPMISQGFLTTTANFANYAVDSTNTKLLITTTTGGALTDVPAGYKCSFEILLSEQPWNK